MLVRTPPASLFVLVALCLALPLLSGTRSLAQPTANAAPVQDEPAAEDPDRALETRLRNVFREVDELHGLEVRVRSGIVHITGRVPSEDAQARARTFAEGMPGVLYVEVHAEVDQELDGRVNATWSRLQARAAGLVARGPLYLIALAIVGAGVLLARLVRQPSPERVTPQTPLLKQLVRQLLATLIIIAAMMLAMDLLGATGLIEAALGTAGVMGLALGFALKDIIENYLAGVLLAIRHPFAPDELVKVGLHEGKVVRLTARDTLLMTSDGNHLRISNAEVFKSAITNFTRNPLRRFTFTINVQREHDLTQVKRTIEEALVMDGVLTNPPIQLRLERIDTDVSELFVAGWVDQRANDFSKVRSEALRRTRVALDCLDEPEQELAKKQSEELHDVSPDEHLSSQVAEERRVNDERDLLKA